MQISNRIDHLIRELTELKPKLENNSLSNLKKFNELLNSSIEDNKTVTEEVIEVALSSNAKLESGVPSWVDPGYDYDPQNPRKPNMRELMEAITGKKLEDLHAEPDGNWKKIRDQAVEVLHGVVGSNEDTRDWLSIMASENILTEAQKQTTAMYEPEVDIIKSNFDENGILTGQIAVIKDSKGNILRSLSSYITSAEETLLNFGATKESIPTNLADRIDPNIFDSNLLNFLKNFDNNPTSVQQVVAQSASEFMANKISQEIPLDELAKL
jgi:ribosomal protein S17E